MEYQDFVIRVRDYKEVDDTHDSFTVEIVESPLGRQTQGQQKEYNAEMLRKLLRLVRSTSRRTKLSGKALENLGLWLTQNLLPSNVLFWLKASLFQAIFRHQGLRIILWLDDPKAAQIPWEYLYVPMPTFEIGFLALNPLTPVIRDQAFFGYVEAVEAKPQGKALLGIAEPKTLFGSQLSDLDDFTGRGEAQEDDIILTRLQDILEQEGPIEIIPKNNLTADVLETESENAYDMFCFYGHGGHRDELQHLPALPEDPSLSLIALEKEPRDNDEGELYSVGVLAEHLKKMGVQVAVLGACQTGLVRGEDTGEQAWLAAMPTLLERGRVPVVVGMQGNIGKMACLRFTVNFFTALSVGLSLEKAVTLGRIAIRNLELEAQGSDLDEEDQLKRRFSRDWGLPTLYRHAREIPNLAMMQETEHANDFKSQAREEAIQRQLGSSPYSTSHTRNFAGRTWALEEINRWLDRRDLEERPQVLQISGPPGSGRTTLATRLTEISAQGPDGIVEDPEKVPHLKRGFLSVIHFCSKHHSHWNSYETFTESIGLQLAIHSRAYADQLEKAFTDLTKDLSTATARSDARIAFTKWVRESFDDSFANHLRGDLIILIDAIDAATNLENLLAGADDVPRHVRFIVTTDEEWTNKPDWIKKREQEKPGSGVQVLSLANDEPNAGQIRSDIDNYVDTFIETEIGRGYTDLDLQEQDPKDLKDIVWRISDGIMLGAVKLFEWIKARPRNRVDQNLDLAKADIDAVLDLCKNTRGMDALNKAILDDLCTEDTWQTRYKPLFEILTAAAAPLRAKDIEEKLGFDPMERLDDPLVQLYLEVAPSLVTGETTFALYHPSLKTFLLDKERADKYAILEFEYRQRRQRERERWERTGGFMHR